MSGLNTFVPDNGAAPWIASDGAEYDSETGALVGMRPKVYAVAHCHAAVGVRSTSSSAILLVHLLEAAENYDALKRDAVETLRPACLALKAGLELHVIGWTNAGRADGFVVRTNAIGDDMTMEQVSAFAIAPCEPGPMYSGVCDAIGGKTPDALDPRRDSLAILQAQRAHAIGGIFGIGGFVQLTIGYRDKIETEILHRWPADRVGSSICPSLDAANAELSLAMASHSARCLPGLYR
jgi:hypothetical protein